MTASVGLPAPEGGIALAKLPEGHRLSCSPVVCRNPKAPWAGVELEEREAENPADRSVSRTVTVPKAWSKEAGEVLAWRFCRRNDPKDPDSRESDVREVIGRICGAWEEASKDMWATPSDRRAWGAEMRAMMIRQMAAPNSPQWFNTGLALAYGLKGPDRGLWRNAAPGGSEAIPRPRPAGDSLTWPLASACFILRVEDDLSGPNGIMDTWLREARIFSGGAGAGANFSTLRAAGEPLSNGGASSGLLSFLRVGDAAAGAIKSGGGTRRAAKMVVVDADHPEVLDVVRWKAGEEAKAAMLAEGRRSLAAMVEDALAGRDAPHLPRQLASRAALEGGAEAVLPEMTLDWRGNAYGSVSGQNANVSVRVNDAFMRLATGEERGRWTLRPRTPGGEPREADASEMLDGMARAAWACADPGIQFHDTINAWNTAGATHELRATNPCSEYTHVDESACNLASLNLGRFLSGAPDGGDGAGMKALDEALLSHAARMWTVALEATCGMAGYPTESIAGTVAAHRALGLGICDLGGVLMRLGIPYDSDRGRALGAGAMSLVQASAWRMSAEMAAVRGPCAAARPNAEEVERVVARHAAAARAEGMPPGGHLEEWAAAEDAVRLHSVRNMQVSVIAPTGTIGPLMDVATTGIEPEFSLVRTKTLAGGGSWTLENPALAEGLKALGHSEGEAEAALAQVRGTGSLEGSGLPEGTLRAFDCAVPAKPGGRSIPPMAHVRMLEALQPFVSGAISKTVNMPEEATPEDVRGILVEAWRRGVKCISVYRDGSKLSQPVTAGAGEPPAPAPAPKPAPGPGEGEGPKGPPPPGRRRSLPDRRQGTTDKVRIGGTPLFLRTGLYKSGELGEIFLDGSKQGSSLSGWQNAFAILFSIALQHGVPLARLVRAFMESQFEPRGPVQGDPDIRFASSPLDWIANRLAIDHLEDPKGLRARGGVSASPSPSFPPGPPDPPGASGENPRTPEEGLEIPVHTGEICPECGDSRMVRSGTCLTCQGCGATTGCA